MTYIFKEPNLTQPIIKRRDTGQFSVLWFQQLLTCFSVLCSNFLFSLSRTMVRFPYFYTVSFSSFVVMTHTETGDFLRIFIKICHRNGYKFHWKTKGGFLEFALIGVEADNNRKQCSIYITFRREEQVTWPLAPGFILSASKEPLILTLQCINYKYYFLFSLSWWLFIFGLFILCYLNVKITRASTCSRMQY